MRAIAVVVALSAGLAGCVGLSRSAPVAPLPSALAAGAHIEAVTLTTGEHLKVSEAFAAIFEQRVKAKLAECAHGPRPLSLAAHVERLDKANPVLTAVIAGSNVLRGTARITDPATGQVVGDYQIGRTVVGGRFAVVVMAEAEEQLSDAFGEELCQQAFAASPN